MRAHARGSGYTKAGRLLGGVAWPSGSSGAFHAGGGGGFAALEAGCWRVVDVSEPRVVQFPPFGGGQAAT